MSTKVDLKKCFTFDFECTSREPSNCYLASFCRLDNEDIKKVKIITGDVNGKPCMSKIIDYIFSFKNGTTFYAHNLTYDISFVLSWLFQNRKDKFKIVRQVLLPLTKKFFTIEILHNNRRIKFKDTFTLFSAPLSKVLESYTNLEKTKTPIFDYWSDIKLDSYVIKYSKIDALGLAISLRKRLEFGRNSLTTASGAMKEFKHLMEKHYGSDNYNNLIPKIDYLTDQKLRPAYRGGFTYVNPMHQSNILHNVHKIDVNSMYPAQMYNNYIPIGEPEIIKDGEVITDNYYKLGIQTFSVNIANIKEGYCPFLSAANSFTGANIYLSHLTEDLDIEEKTFSLTLQEFELFKESYEYQDLKLKGGFLFKANNNLFKKYIDKFWEMKSSKDSTIKSLGKLFLNSLYGKFAESYEKINFEVDYDEKIIYKETSREIRECGYLPAAIFITSYSRVFLIRSILNVGFKQFVYCDTDSIHFLCSEQIEEYMLNSKLEFDEKEIGKWNYEGKYERALYLRAKRYCGEILNKETNQIELQAACAGISKQALKEQVGQLENFQVGRKIEVNQFVRGQNGMSVVSKFIKI